MLAEKAVGSATTDRSFAVNAAAVASTLRSTCAGSGLPPADSVNANPPGDGRTIGSENWTCTGARIATFVLPGAGVRETTCGGVRSTTITTGSEVTVLSDKAISAAIVWVPSVALVVFQSNVAAGECSVAS